MHKDLDSILIPTNVHQKRYAKTNINDHESINYRSATTNRLVIPILKTFAPSTAGQPQWDEDDNKFLVYAMKGWSENDNSIYTNNYNYNNALIRKKLYYLKQPI